MSDSPNREIEGAVALLQAELTRVRDSSVEAWRGYLTWFTWFYGTQILVLGWIMTQKAEHPNRTNIIVLASGAIILNILGVVATFRNRGFAALQATRFERICRDLANCAEKMGLTIEITPGYPSDLIRGAYDAGALALPTAAAVWLYVLFAAAT